MKQPLNMLITMIAAFTTAIYAAQTPKPNILWIVMDDIGVELPCYGEKHIETPNIDRLVRKATRFEMRFSPHLFAPNRALR